MKGITKQVERKRTRSWEVLLFGQYDKNARITVAGNNVR